MDLRVTASQAGSAVGTFIREMNQSRRIPKVPKFVQDMAEQGKVYIYNVGPWEWEKGFGSDGMKKVPGCPKGKPYSSPLVFKGVELSMFVANQDSFGYNQEDGQYYAEQFVGVGPFTNEKQRLLKFGVFIAAGEKPTKEELAEANRQLDLYALELIQEADVASDKGPTEANSVLKGGGGKHFWAAHRMNVTDRPWQRSIRASSNKTCPMCGASAIAEAVICATAQCGHIYDEDKYIAAEKKKKALLARI